MKTDDFANLETRINNFFSNKKIDTIFRECFLNTIQTTCQFDDDDSVFVVTGDIPAMWLRDSAAQVMQYLFFLDDVKVDALIRGVIKKQFTLILEDPYANSFMHDKNCKSEYDGKIKSDFISPLMWERKFELDSLCYPFFLAVKYYEQTNKFDVFDTLFLNAFDKTIEVINKEQHHSSKSTYYFVRQNSRGVEDVGRNTNPKEEKGLVWTGFRPSDDACKYNYHIPDNMFLVTVLHRLHSIFETLKDQKRALTCQNLELQLKELIEQYGVINDEKYGRLYVSETNCLGNYVLDDDANIPSLLSIPYLEYPYIDQSVYENTRKYILSKNNKYYYEGNILKGIGSPHTPNNRVWPLAISMQGITSNDSNEIYKCFKMLISSTFGSNLMHESVDVNDVSIFSRPWFAWANSLFSYFCIIKKKEIKQGLNNKN